MGHKLQMYENLRDIVERELGEIERKRDINKESLDNLFKLTSSLKVIDKCIEKKEMEENGGVGGGSSYNYSGRGMYSRNSYDDMSHMWPTPYMLEQEKMSRMNPNDRIRAEMEREMSNGSYAMGNSNARRGRDGDGDGRYSEDNFRDRQDRGGQSNEGYSRDQGYSRDASRKKMVQKLETLMDDTMSEKERQAIQECISKIDK